MEYSIVLILIGIILLGAFFQTAHLFPTFFDKYFDIAASKITIAFILILVSMVGLSFFLRGRNREGFETEGPNAMKLWNELTEKYQIKDVCEMKSSIQDKLIAIEKGIPPNAVTDDQAREQVEKIFTKGTSNGTVNCESFQKVNDAKDIDSFFTVVQELPDSFLIQVQDTAERIKSLLEKQYSSIANSLAKKEEGFVDTGVGICSPEIVEERRKFLRQKKLDEDAQRCLLPEEVPFESKDTIAVNKIKKIQAVYDAYIRMSPGKPTISELLTKSKEYEEKLNDQKEAVKQLSEVV